MVSVHRSHAHSATTNDVAGGQSALHPGAQGAAVKHVQQLLKRKGAHNIAADGDFGPKTEHAVKHFQSTHGLRANGVVDHNTLRALEGPNVHHPDEFLKNGDDNAHVKRVETGLKALGYNPGAVDGKYDADTARAVAAYKHDEGIKKANAGAINGAEQKKIRTELHALDHDPQHTRVKPSNAHRRLDRATSQAARGADGIGPGSNTRAVMNVQSHLKSAGFDPKHANGQFDERTQTAVRAFQKHANLPVTGRVDSDTWRKLAGAQMEARTGTSPAQRLGERSAAVLKSEKLLQKLHMNPGKVDGVFDEHTLAASKRFEKKHHGFGNDGAIDARQLKAMQKAAEPKENLHSVKGCAQFLLHSKNVSFWSGLSSGSDRKNVERLARGQSAFVPATGGHTKPTLQLMQALVDMAKHGPIMINALTGGTHTAGSNHYRGHAVDLDLSVGNTAQIERIARQHGGARNFETSHIHLDF